MNQHGWSDHSVVSDAASVKLEELLTKERVHITKITRVRHDDQRRYLFSPARFNLVIWICRWVELTRWIKFPLMSDDYKNIWLALAARCHDNR